MKVHLKKNDKELYCGRVLAPHWGLKFTTDKDKATCRICRALTNHKEFDDVFRGFSYRKAIEQNTRFKS